MEKVRLGECASYINGYAFKPSDWRKEGIPIIRIQDLTGTINNPNFFQGEIDEKYLIDNGDVLISWSGSLGIYHWNKGKAYLNQHIFKVDFNKKDIDKKYFIYLIKSKIEDMIKNTHGSTMKHITKSNFDKIEINLHDLTEQKKIAIELDNIQEIIDIRKKQIEDLDELIKSKFVKMFYNGRYDKKCLNDISIIKGEYGSGASAGEYIKGQPRYVRITDIQEDGRLNNNSMASPKNENNLEKYALDYGDVLFARTGATVGKTYKYSKDDGYCIYAGYCIRFRLDLEKVNPEYIFTFTKTEEYKKWVANKQRVVAQPNINAKEYGNDLLIPIPPIELQNRFAEFVKLIDKQKVELQKSLEEIQKLQESLMNKYFGG